MNVSCMNVIAYFVKKAYPRTFTGDALEAGSLDVNGTVRPLFVNARKYVGVDWRPGPCVDVVSLVHEMPFEAESFDVVVSSSMLEHDPYWQKSLTKMVDVLKPDGVLMLTWGGKRNRPHCPAAAVDGGFHPRSRKEIAIWLNGLGVKIGEMKSVTSFNCNSQWVATHKSRVSKASSHIALLGFKADGKNSTAC